MTSILDAGMAAMRAVRAVASVLTIVFFAYMALAVLAQVLGRYFFNFSIGWAAETATFAQIWMIFLGAGLAMRERLHVGVDILYAALPRLLQRILVLLIFAAGLWFLWVTVAGSFRLISIGFRQTSSVLQMPMWIPYLALPVGLSYFALEFALLYVEKAVAAEDRPKFDSKGDAQ